MVDFVDTGKGGSVSMRDDDGPMEDDDLEARIFGNGEKIRVE